MLRVLLTRRSIDAFFILLASLLMSACEPAVKRDDARLAADPSAVAELKRIDALLATKRPLTRLEVDSLERLRTQYTESRVVRDLLQGCSSSGKTGRLSNG